MKGLFRQVLWVGCAILIAAAASGCMRLGPDMVRSGRPAYNDAILATADGQLLQNIVRIRFLDSIGFLTVNAITASFSVSASGSVDVGWGSTGNYAGNLVPFRGGVTAEQNPTISYSPVSGDHLLRQFVAEIPVERAILIIRSARDPGTGWRAVVRRVNNLRNPDFPEPPQMAVDPRFEEVVHLLGELQRIGILYWVKLTGAQSGFGFVLHSYSPANSREAARLLELLGIPRPEREGRDVVVPVQSSVGSPEPGSISIESRSVLDLMRLAAAGIEVPANTPGALRFPERGPAAQGFRIHSSSSEPSDTRVLAKYRGRWYYIDNNDEASKQWFIILQLLVNAQLPDISAGTVPVLTIPVKR